MTENIRESDAKFVEDWHAFRAGWEQWLTQPHGWLSVVSMNWTEPTPIEYPGQPGLWWQEGNLLCVDPQGQTMSYEGESFTSVRKLDLTETEDDVRIVAGDVQVGVTYRGQYLLLNYDPEAPKRSNFKGVPTFEPDPRWVLKGKFEAHGSPKTLSIDSVGADAENLLSPGVVKLSHAGQDYTLTVTDSHGMKTLVFADATSGDTTYGACRGVSVSEPDEEGMVLLDFNRALNLPCAFNSLPVCPAAPPENRLAFAVEAGEKIPYEN